MICICRGPEEFPSCASGYGAVTHSNEDTVAVYLEDKWGDKLMSPCEERKDKWPTMKLSPKLFNASV